MIYYFDGSDAPAFHSALSWTDINNGFDGSFDTVTTGTVAGSASAENVLTCGTNAPAVGHLIEEVSARIYGKSINSPTGNASIYTDDLGELLGTATNAEVVSGWGSFTVLSVPTGGWTWEKICALEVKLFMTGGLGSPSFECGMIEIDVKAYSGTGAAGLSYIQVGDGMARNESAT